MEIFISVLIFPALSTGTGSKKRTKKEKRCLLSSGTFSCLNVHSAAWNLYLYSREPVYLNVKHTYSEKDLLQQVAEGNEYAFAALFRQHHQPLGEFLLTLTQSKETTEEIVQEAFIKAWQKRTELSGVDNFRSWLFIICRNRAYNYMRDNARLALKHKEWGRQQETAVAGEQDKKDPEFLNHLLEQAVAKLPPQQQRAYLLSRQQGMKHEQIAAEMQLSKETVKRHISLALQSIAEYLRTHYPAALALFLVYSGKI